MEQMQQRDVGALDVRNVPQKELEQACFHTLDLIGRNCEYLEQHLVHTGADSQSCQAVADIGAATAKLDRTVNEIMTLLEYLRAEDLPQLYPMDLCGLLRQITAQADVIRAQLKVELTLDCGGWTACRVMGDRDDAELLLLHLLSNALHACSAGGTVQIQLRRSENFWQLIMVDDGCGLPDKSREAWLENRRCFLGGARLGLLLSRECSRRMGWGLRVEHAPEASAQAVLTIPLCAERGMERMVELHSENDVQQREQRDRLRAMLVQELRTMPERGDPDEL